MMMKFYYFFGICLLVLYIVLWEIGFEFDLVCVDLVNGIIESGDDYSKFNFCN